MSTEVERLAARIVGLERSVQTLSIAPRLAYSSIEDGAVNGYDREGNLQIVVGKQWDGSQMASSVGGPVPPDPAGLTVVPVVGGLLVRWDGIFYQDAVVPMDFSRCEIHVSTVPGFTPQFATTLKGTFETPRGGEVFIALPYAVHEVTLVARALSGKVCPMANLVRAQGIPLKVRDTDLDFDISELGKGTRIFSGPDDPGTLYDDVQIGEFWLKAPDNIWQRWDGTSWVEVQDAGIAEALTTANAAAEKANQASSDALAALDAAQDAGITTYKQDTTPSDADIVVGSFWIDTAHGNLLKRWSGTAWDPVQDQAVITAINSAATAQATADGKVRTFIQDATPAPTPPMGAGDVGDLWILPGSGNLMRSWDGTQWVSRQIGNAAVAPNSLVASNVIATGSITASLLTTDMVLSTRIVGGALGGRRVEIKSAGIFAYDALSNLTFSATGDGTYIKGQIQATTFTSYGASPSGTYYGRYIEIGSAGANELNNDEIRLWNGSTARASVRNPNSNPGRLRFSTISASGVDGQIDFDPTWGVMTPRVMFGPVTSVASPYIEPGPNLYVHANRNGASVYNYSLEMGTIESSGHGWVASPAVGLAMLAGTPQVNVRYGNNSDYADLKARNIYYTTLNPVSALRYKTDVVPLSLDGLSVVRSVEPHLWRWLDEAGERTEHDGLGFIVEHLRDAAPHITRGQDDTYDLTALIATLWTAVRQLDRELVGLRR